MNLKKKIHSKANKKWTDTGVNVCYKAARNRKIGLAYRKGRRKPALTSKQKKTSLLNRNNYGVWKIG